LIFQIGSTLTTASGSYVNVSNGSSLSGVYWQVGSSATLGTGTIFAGNILALDSVTLAPQADILCGRAFALTGAVTLIDNLISNNNAVKDFGSYGFSNGFHSPTVVPEPVSVLLFGLGGVSMACVRSRRKA
jgi:type VI secretion system secreted protein VgrG